MNLQLLLFAPILFPILGAALLGVLPIGNEKVIGRLAVLSTVLSSIFSFAIILFWAAGGFHTLATSEFRLIDIAHYKFEAGLTFNAAAAAFLFLIEFTSGMVIRFSRVYMHREPGYRRFFAIILMFQGAMSLLTLASNLDLLFCGWEMVGMASFFLIAFYSERKTPVANALKVFSVYRIADIGLFLSAYLEHSSSQLGIGLLLLLAAAGKSAQFPFSFWIARAMEGPTPSSALFYGALSVNAGAFLLMKTYSIWSVVPALRIGVGVLGLLTAILCTMFSRVQHTIKAQIGYASVTQVGLVFLELALGLKTLAIIHMVSNAILRCYQLLVSPSAVAYLLRRQSASDGARPSERHSFFQRLFTREARSTLYVFAISEGYLEMGLRYLLWRPLRWFGSYLKKGAISWIVFGLFLLIMVYLIGLGGATLVAAASLSALALANHDSPQLSFSKLLLSGILVAVSVSLQAGAGTSMLAFFIYTGSIAVLGIFALIGFGHQHSVGRFFALTGTLALTGFPLLPSFFGEDMLLHQAFAISFWFAIGLATLFALNGYVAMRIFALKNEPRFALQKT